MKKNEHPEDGCDWASFGLFGTLGKGDIVVDEDGSEIEVFKWWRWIHNVLARLCSRRLCLRRAAR